MFMDLLKKIKEFLQSDFMVSDFMLHMTLWQCFQFVFALIMCAIMAWILGKVYVRFGNSLSNRKAFSKNFVVLACTTMFIIMVVKSSLALSLGLVGALSIVRFRAAIKEPEELTYLFLNIAIGLGCGASQLLITGLSFVSIVAFIIVSKLISEKQKNDNSKTAGMTCYILIVCENQSVGLSQIIDILSANCNTLKLKRTDKANGRVEASFYIDFDQWNNFENIEKQLTNLDENMKITFMDTSKDY